MALITLITRNNNTSGSVPPSGSLVSGELAVNVEDGGLYYHNSGSDTPELVRTIASQGSGSFSGSFSGSAADLIGTVSASFAITASHALNAAGGDGGSSNGFTSSFDAVNVSGSGKWRHKTEFFSTSSLARSTEGLVFRDQFNRPDDVAVGPGWSETPDFTFWDLQGNKSRHITPNTSYLTLTGSASPPADMIAQCNFQQQDGTSIRFALRSHTLTEGHNTDYETLIAGPSSNLYWLTKEVSGSSEINDNHAFNGLVSGTWYTSRMILETTGSELKVSGTMGEATDEDDLTAALVTCGSFLDPTPLVENNVQALIAFGNVFHNEFIMCGRNVTVNNLPTGFKVKLDGDSAVVESGGSGTINVDSRILPYGTMSVLNASDELQSSLIITSATLSDGWGGDIYDFADAIGGEEQNYHILPLEDDGTELGNVLSLQRDGDIEVSGGLGSVSASQFTGTASFATTASFANTASLAETASFSIVITQSINSDTASFILGANVSGPVTSSSFAETASFAENAGAPGLSFNFFDVDAIPSGVLTSSLNDEFEETTLDSKWQPLDTGSLSSSFRGDSLFRLSNDFQEGRLHRFAQLVPSGSWTMRIKVAHQGPFTAQGYIGLFLENVGNSNLEQFAVGHRTNPAKILFTWNTPTSFGSVITSPDIDGDTQTGWWYLEIEYDGTNIDYRTSLNGISFKPLLSTRTTASFLGGAPTKLGISAYKDTTSTDFSASVDWFRLTTGTKEDLNGDMRTVSIQ